MNIKFLFNVDDDDDDNLNIVTMIEHERSIIIN